LKRRATRAVPPLQVVTGKGGVGKSTFAAALALAAVHDGREVLAIEMGEPSGLARLFGVRPERHGVPIAVAPQLSLAYYDGEAALAEYLGRFMPWTGVIQSVLSHPLYRAFVSAGPGVRELMAIGKVRDELLGLSSGRPLWDLIVVDAGASGHALQLLGMASATARTFRRGLAHREAERVAGVLADPEQTAVHVVALPEEMPLEEAAEVIEKLRGELELPVGHLVVNQCRPLAPSGAAEATAALELDSGGDPARRSLALAARRALGWLRLQEAGIAALERRVGLRAKRLPRLAGEPFAWAEVERLAACLADGRPDE
jgi:anion-transporting  ArsA/GET3 family ATPase